ncbi:MAG: hypothetical protein Fur006_69580 [Coleofasciculaceae cyanobacterium]
MSLFDDPEYIALKVKTQERQRKTAEIQAQWKPRGDLSERLHPHKERIAKANAEWEARQKAREEIKAASRLTMTVAQQDNELYIELTHTYGDKDLEVQAAQKVMKSLQAVCDRLGITLSTSDQ